MRFSGIKIGFGFTGSHCTIGQVLPVFQQLKDEDAELLPIFSDSVCKTDTRYGKAEDWWKEVTRISGKEPLTSLVEVEPIGPQRLIDVMVVAPCTGNTLAKVAQGITDSSVTLACKAHLRNNRPLLLAISTNDALGANAHNLATLLNRKNVYFVPFGQDAPSSKHTSLIAKMEKIPDTVLEALEHRQIQPLIISLTS
jgi:dipicolinate synthase subunit B